VDTSASSSDSFKFLRTYAAQMTMTARGIVERINVVRYLGLRKLATVGWKQCVSDMAQLAGAATIKLNAHRFQRNSAIAVR
jgi:hypothetical protein